MTEAQKRRDSCRAYLNVYVRRGKVQRKRCEVCGRKAVEALHLNCSKPLEVKWLCRRHHLETRFHPRLATGAEKGPSQ